MGVHASYPDVELEEREFERLLELVDALDMVQLLRLQCKVAAVLTEREKPERVARLPERDTRPPPSGLGGPYAGDTYEELSIDWESEPTDPGV